MCFSSYSVPLRKTLFPLEGRSRERGKEGIPETLYIG
jgi:hypothetical protein